MPCQNAGCLRQYRYEQIAHYARKRYVDGIGTIELMSNARSDEEKSLIALASLLDLDDDRIRELRPYCNHECQQMMFDLRDRLRIMVEDLLSARRECHRKWKAPQGACGKSGNNNRSHDTVFAKIRNNRVLTPILSG